MLHQPCILGGPQRQARGENQKWLPHPCLLGGPQQRGQNQSGPRRGWKCYISPAFSGVPNAKRGEKIRSGYLTPAFSGVPNKGDKIKVGLEEGGNATSALHSRGSPTPSAGRKSEVATSPVPSRGSPTKGTKSKWAHKRAEMLHHPCILGGPQRQARGENQKWLRFTFFVSDWIKSAWPWSRDNNTRSVTIEFVFGCDTRSKFPDPTFNVLFPSWCIQ